MLRRCTHCVHGAQAGVFSTFVYAVRRMALEDWPGFARGGALWFPDLRQAAHAVFSPDAVPAAAGAGKAPRGCQCLTSCQRDC